MYRFRCVILYCVAVSSHGINDLIVTGGQLDSQLVFLATCQVLVCIWKIQILLLLRASDILRCVKNTAKSIKTMRVLLSNYSFYILGIYLYQFDQINKTL